MKLDNRTRTRESSEDDFDFVRTTVKRKAHIFSCFSDFRDRHQLRIAGGNELNYSRRFIHFTLVK